MEIKKGYIRVSQVLSQWDRFGHIDPVVLQRKAGIGTAVHGLIEAECQGIYVEGNQNCQGYLDSFRRWKQDSGVQISETEKRFYDDALGITGCIDGLARFHDADKLTIIDYKTSASENPKIWPMQAVFYHYLTQVNKFDPSPRVIFLKLDKMGKKPQVFEYHYSKEMLNVCLSALNCYKYLNGG